MEKSAKDKLNNKRKLSDNNEDISGIQKKVNKRFPDIGHFIEPVIKYRNIGVRSGIFLKWF